MLISERQGQAAQKCPPAKSPLGGAVKMLTQAHLPIHPCAVSVACSNPFPNLFSAPQHIARCRSSQWKVVCSGVSQMSRPHRSAGGRAACWPRNSLYSDSTRESQKLPQFSDSHDRSPLGTSSSEPGRLPEIVIPASASNLQYPFGFAMVFQETYTGRTFLPPQEGWLV